MASGQTDAPWRQPQRGRAERGRSSGAPGGTHGSTADRAGRGHRSSEARAIPFFRGRSYYPEEMASRPGIDALLAQGAACVRRLKATVSSGGFL